MPITAEDVLACGSFDDARQKYPDVIGVALKDGPPEAVFRAHWSAGAEYHDSLKNVIAQSAAAAAAAAAPAPEPPRGQVRAEEILACSDFNEARSRYPAVMQLALKDGPSEAIFRDNWTPSAKYHDSLRSFIANSCATLPAAAPTPQEDEGPPPLLGLEKMELRRTQQSEWWGFLLGRNLKVLEITQGTPAERAGLKTGVYIAEVQFPQGEVIRVGKPQDAYGPANSLDMYMHVFISKTQPPPVVQAPPEVEKKEEEKRVEKRKIDSSYADVGFSIEKRPKEEGDAAGGAESGRHRVTDADRVALDYIIRQRSAAEQRKGSSYLPKGGAAQQKAASKFGSRGEPMPRVARVGDRVFRRDGKTISECGWTLPDGESAEVIGIWRSNDRRNGQLQLKQLPNGKQSEWLPAEGWRFSTAGLDWGVDCMAPPPQSNTKSDPRGGNAESTFGAGHRGPGGPGGGGGGGGGGGRRSRSRDRGRRRGFDSR